MSEKQVTATEANANRLKLAGRLGIQLYMLGAELGADLPGTLKALHDIGYREVEVVGLQGLTPEEYRAELDRAGLVCTSCHLGLEATMPGVPSLLDPAATIAQMKALGATHAVAGSFPFMQHLMERPDAAEAFADMERIGQIISEIAHSLSVEDWIGVAKQLNEAGAALAVEGIRVGYHNHNFEFLKLPNGQTVMEVLLDNTDPALVDFELDLGWAYSAGVDPVAFLKRYAGRITQVHLKDSDAVEPNTHLHIKSADIGQGVLPWTELLEMIRALPVQHAYVEQEPPFALSPMELLKASYGFVAPLMAQLGV